MAISRLPLAPPVLTFKVPPLRVRLLFPALVPERPMANQVPELRVAPLPMVPIPEAVAPADAASPNQTSFVEATEPPVILRTPLPLVDPAMKFPVSVIVAPPETLSVPVLLVLL